MANKNITPSSSIELLLKSYNACPSKDLGQNFLIDESAFNKIIAASDLKKEDIVMEIGPGPGNLTEKLAKGAGKVIAIEKDEKMAEILHDKLKDIKNVTIIKKDILKINISEIIKKPSSWKIVANIPYYLTSPIIRLFLEHERKPSKMILLIQKEVGQRIVANDKDASVISILVQFYGKAKIIGLVPKESFWPEPKVDSVIIKIYDIKKPENFDEKTIKDYFRLVKIGFSSRRKTLANNLSAGFKTPKNKIIEIIKSEKLSPNVRAQELSVEDWKKLLFNKEIVSIINKLTSQLITYNP